MNNFEQKINKPEPEKPESNLNLYQDFEVVDERSGMMRATDSFGEERVIVPDIPPIIREREVMERKQAGIAPLIDQLPEQERLKIKEGARLAAADELQKRMHLLSPRQAGEELQTIIRQKEWELAAKWLKEHPEKNQKPAA